MTLTGLDMFLRSRGVQQVRDVDMEGQGESRFFDTETTPIPTDTAPQDSSAATSKPQVVSSGPTTDLTVSASIVTSPVPIVTRPVKLVICTRFLTRRTLLRHFHRLCPSAEIIERDFVPASAASAAAASRSALASYRKPGPEVDLIISPSVGVISTTLQRIRQRALPGGPQALESDDRERVKMVRKRYETLYVLVADRSAKEGATGPDNEADSKAWTAFANFVAKQNAEVVYVPGDESKEAQSIARLLDEYGMDEKLDQVETRVGGV